MSGLPSSLFLVNFSIVTFIIQWDMHLSICDWLSVFSYEHSEVHKAHYSINLQNVSSGNDKLFV